ncbi:hypothetical protein MsAg5_18040 [Methanosarcinaceae archaeon Ag5]|uniref:CHAD domain-containing protein n=1 Tax=Methanolapillus africanus TaxID=3028297 RepID=A0AAE4MJS4_9EURY|nr:hypothetical protein [Methanosarcinaceae archaeon Ag5]
MEIEYKFGVLKPETHNFLKTIPKTGSFVIETGNPVLFSDTFYDTDDFLLLSVGYYLRAREEAGADGVEWTLKSLGGYVDGVHKRMEAKQKLPKGSTVKDIDNPDFLKKIMFAVGDFDLVPVLSIEQERLFRNVRYNEAGRTNTGSEPFLAEMAVDCVYLELFGQKHTFFELEIELKSGTEKSLREFADALKSEPLVQNNIRTNYLSKFERSLILYFNRDKIDGRVNPAFENRNYSMDAGDENSFDSACTNFLLPSEKAALIQICEKNYETDFFDYFGKNGLFGADSGFDSDSGFGSGSDADSGLPDIFKTQASVLLALDSGLAVSFAALKFNTTLEEITQLYRTFLLSRLSMFPFVFESDENPAYYLQKPISDGKIWTADELTTSYGADVSDVRFGKSRAENMSYFAEFFASGQEKEDTPADKKTHSEKILKNLAVLSGVGKGISIERNSNITKDIVLTHPLKGMTLNDLKMMGLVFVLENIQNPSLGSIRNAIQSAGYFVPPALQRKALVSASFLQIVNRLEKESASIREIAYVERNTIEESDEYFELNLETEDDGVEIEPETDLTPEIDIGSDADLQMDFDIVYDIGNDAESYAESDVEIDLKINAEIDAEIDTEIDAEVDIEIEESVVSETGQTFDDIEYKFSVDSAGNEQFIIHETAVELEKFIEIYYTSDKKTKPKRRWSALFRFVFGIPVRFIRIGAAADDDDENAKEKDKIKSGKVSLNDMMANASEKIFLTQMAEVVKCEPGVIEGVDIEAVHDMRVALRKMRSSITIFYEFLDPEWILKTEDSLKKTLAPLGESRDLDVLLEKTDVYLKNAQIPPSRLDIFFELVANDKEKAHEHVISYLNSAEYSGFKTEIQKTLTKCDYIGTPQINKKGDVAPSRVADVLPQVLYEKAAGITAYHEWMDGPFIYIDKLHRLRIAAKNFRYTLDFFKDGLGETAVKLTKEFKELQDILGDFHDAVVAVEVIENYVRRIEEMKLKIETEKGGGGSDDNETAAFESVLSELSAYKTYREEEIETLLFKFRDVWTKMDRKFFHERISKIIEEAGL